MYNDLVPIKQKADEWGLSVRRVQMLCKASQIDGATKVNGQWHIPMDSDKPTEGRWPENEINSDDFGKVNIDLKYVSMLSHDIRNALNSILGYTELICNSSDDKDLVSEYAANIRNAGQDLLLLTNNIIDLSEIKANKVRVDESDFEIRKIVDTVCELESQVAYKKNINVVTNFNIKNEAVNSDKDKLTRILCNVLDNAIKFSKDNELVQIRVDEIGPTENGLLRYNYSIVDNGIGMTESEIKHIYDNFVKLNTDAEGLINSGNGLGMSITKGLVKSLDGEIRIISQKGLGTKVVITIDHKPSTVDSDIKIENNDYKGKRILLAEDDELNREIEKVILEKAGFTVETAQDGIVCIAMLETKEAGYYDAILMDLTMPNMGGAETSRFIRELTDKKKADIPIIAMTASVLSKDRDTARYSGMDGFVEKPIEIEKVIGAFREIL